VPALYGRVYKELVTVAGAEGGGARDRPVVASSYCRCSIIIVLYRGGESRTRVARCRVRGSSFDGDGRIHISSLRSVLISTFHILSPILTLVPTLASAKPDVIVRTPTVPNPDTLIRIGRILGDPCGEPEATEII
jgi:hypothetical protein